METISRLSGIKGQAAALDFAIFISVCIIALSYLYIESIETDDHEIELAEREKINELATRTLSSLAHSHVDGLEIRTIQPVAIRKTESCFSEDIRQVMDYADKSLKSLDSMEEALRTEGKTTLDPKLAFFVNKIDDLRSNIHKSDGVLDKISEEVSDSSEVVQTLCDSLNSLQSLFSGYGNMDCKSLLFDTILSPIRDLIDESASALSGIEAELENILDSSDSLTSASADAIAELRCKLRETKDIADSILSYIETGVDTNVSLLELWPVETDQKSLTVSKLLSDTIKSGPDFATSDDGRAMTASAALLFLRNKDIGEHLPGEPTNTTPENNLTAEVLQCRSSCPHIFHSCSKRTSSSTYERCMRSRLREANERYDCFEGCSELAESLVSDYAPAQECADSCPTPRLPCRGDITHEVLCIERNIRRLDKRIDCLLECGKITEPNELTLTSESQKEYVKILPKSPLSAKSNNSVIAPFWDAHFLAESYLTHSDNLAVRLNVEGPGFPPKHNTNYFESLDYILKPDSTYPERTHRRTYNGSAITGNVVEDYVSMSESNRSESNSNGEISSSTTIEQIELTRPMNATLKFNYNNITWGNKSYYFDVLHVCETKNSTHTLHLENECGFYNESDALKSMAIGALLSGKQDLVEISSDIVKGHLDELLEGYHYNFRLADSCGIIFEIFETEPEAPAGTSIYYIRGDGSRARMELEVWK
jgi:hypothetical protein